MFYRNAQIIDTKIDTCSYIGERSYIQNTTIGKYCSLGSELIAGKGTHPANFISISPIFFSNKKQCGISFANEPHFDEMGNIDIGHDVWIGARVFIADNIKIGKRGNNWCWCSSDQKC